MLRFTTNLKGRVVISILSFFFMISTSYAQESSTPLDQYTWNGSKTAFAPGYIVLKSGKRLDGDLSLKGSKAAVTQIKFKIAGNEINFPPAALLSYGLTASPKVETKTEATPTTNKGPVCESPQESFIWLDRGIVMNEKIEVSQPREGYVVVGGKRSEGVLKLKKKGGKITNYELKSSSGKMKGKYNELERYGYKMAAEEIAQELIKNKGLDYLHGKVVLTSGDEKSGLISRINQETFYFKNVIFKDEKGIYTEYGPDKLKSFQIQEANQVINYITIDGKFLKQDYNGNTFMLYRNPAPTTVNQFATDMIKGGVAAATRSISQSSVKKDEKEKGYDSNIDDLLLNGTDEELEEFKWAIAALNKYSSPEEAMENSDNESLKKTITAIELEQMSRKIERDKTTVIYNQEWIILNKKTEEKTVVYKNNYAKLIEPLMKGCYEYLMLDKSQQKKYSKWKGLVSDVQFLDGCY